MRRAIILGITLMFVLLCVTPVVTILCVAHAQAPVAELTEWQLLSDEMPRQIAVSESFVFFADYSYIYGGLGRIGRLDPVNNKVTEWTLPIRTSSSTDMEIETDPFGNQFVFVNDLYEPQIGLLDIANNTFTEWSIGPFLYAPRNLAIDQSGNIFFIVNYRPYPDPHVARIGKLDPGTGTLTLWTPPAALADGNGFGTGALSTIAIDPLGRILFSVQGSSAGHHKMGMLSPDTGTFTAWPLPSGLVTEIRTDSDGNVFFIQLGSWPVRKITRFDPNDGLLTEWDYSSEDPHEYLTVDPLGNIFFSVYGGVTKLNPSVEGVGTFLDPVDYGTVVPTVTVVTPSETSVTPTGYSVEEVESTVTGEEIGAFSEWELLTLSDARAVGADDKGRIFITGPSTGKIGRLDLGAKEKIKDAIKTVESLAKEVLEKETTGVNKKKAAEKMLIEAKVLMERVEKSFETGDPTRLADSKEYFEKSVESILALKEAIVKGEITNPEILKRMKKTAVKTVFEPAELVTETAIKDAIEKSGDPIIIAEAEKELVDAKMEKVAVLKEYDDSQMLEEVKTIELLEKIRKPLRKVKEAYSLAKEAVQ